MLIGPWVLLTLITRILCYACTAMALGGMFTSSLLNQHAPCVEVIRRYTLWGCVAGIIAAVSGIFFQAGAIADQGAAGMLNTDILAILWCASPGKSAAFHIAGFLLIAIISILKASGGRPANRLAIATKILGALLLLAAFTQQGHFADQPSLAKIVLAFHVLSIGLWIGALYPLWRLSHSADIKFMQLVMAKFGRLAVALVAVVLASGLIMACLLLKEFQNLIATAYGVGLLVKLGCVSALLILAASNKWLTVPRLQLTNYRHRLSLAIVVEIIFGIAIFSVTAVITGVIGIDVG